MIPLVSKGNNTLSINRQPTMYGLCDHSGNLFSLTLVYVHADGAECLIIAL